MSLVTQPTPCSLSTPALGTSLVCASLALVDSGIEMLDTPTACSVVSASLRLSCRIASTPSLLFFLPGVTRVWFLCGSNSRRGIQRRSCTCVMFTMVACASSTHTHARTRTCTHTHAHAHTHTHTHTRTHTHTHTHIHTHTHR